LGLKDLDMTFEVTYDHGVFKPKQPINLPEGTTGSVVVSDPSFMSLPSEEWRDIGSVKERIRRISNLSRNNGDDAAVGRNHDKFLYGEGHGA
jgi:predicted DNA-binding antitoxin AbrB/MazE fold protein